jgi:hypothetical protein
MARALTSKEAIGNASKMGGYVAYIPNDAFTSECAAEALKTSISGDPLDWNDNAADYLSRNHGQG